VTPEPPSRSPFRQTQFLLESMARPGDRRGAVVTDGTRERLGEYLRFRQASWESSEADIDWERMRDLVTNSREVFDALRMELDLTMGDERCRE